MGIGDWAQSPIPKAKLFLKNNNIKNYVNSKNNLNNHLLNTKIINFLIELNYLIQLFFFELNF